MQKDYSCSFSILNTDIICEYKHDQLHLPLPIKLHNHDGYEIVLFLGGEQISIFVESERKKLTRGDLILVDSYTFYALDNTNRSSYERVVINIDERYLKKISTESTDLSFCFQQHSSNVLNYIHLEESEIAHFLELSNKLEHAIREDQYGRDILQRAFVSQLMIYITTIRPSNNLFSHPTRIPKIVANTFEYIDKNLATDITVEKIAKSLHHNNDYLSHCFKETTGYTLKHYVNTKRIALAQKQLREGLSPCDVCFRIGFNNYSSFSRTFSKHIGCSPKQYQLMY